MNLIKQIVNKESYAFCVIKKACNISYKSYIRFRRRELDLIYSDICDSITSRGYNDNKYFIIFIDDWDKRSEVEVIEFKSEVFFAFKRY